MAPDPDPAPATITTPFPISRIGSRYLLFDVEIISHVRRTYSICGVLIGTIPNLSQQNVFLGIPLELMPEEARVLVERGLAYVVDDVEAHRKGCLAMGREERLKYLAEMDRQGQELARRAREQAEQRSEKALRERGLTRKIPKEKDAGTAQESADADESLFDSAPSSSTTSVIVPAKKLEPHFITPTTSYPPLPKPTIGSAVPLPEVPKSYPLFRYLNSHGYFMMPGLRFGCHYSVYPGDPLRFHSHFLATGLDWDEEFDLLDVVGGGRLGTGVKKAYLLGGEDGKENEFDGKEERVRAFSIEWAGF